ncbi:MAG TPA: hypothetical protein PLD93_05360, partial [Synergistaceae bacterium]|nr:hypothetical protein [Synergistaceae bacterium]
STGGVGHGLYMKKMGKEKVVEKSGGKPDWVKRGAVFIKGGVLYSVGSLTDSPNLSMGMRVAHKRAQAIIVESLKLHLQSTFREAAEGLNIDQLDIQTMIFSSAEAIVSGFFPNDQYYEEGIARVFRNRIQIRLLCPHRNHHGELSESAGWRPERLPEETDVE